MAMRGKKIRIPMVAVGNCLAAALSNVKLEEIQAADEPKARVMTVPAYPTTQITDNSIKACVLETEERGDVIILAL